MPATEMNNDKFAQGLYWKKKKEHCGVLIVVVIVTINLSSDHSDEVKLKDRKDTNARLWYVFLQ